MRMEIVPDRASAVIAAVLVTVLVLALALLEAMGAERPTPGGPKVPEARAVIAPESRPTLTSPDLEPRFRPAIDLSR